MERLYSSSIQHVEPFYFYIPVLLAGLFPWSPLAAPTRVHFESIEPGDVDRPRDDVVAVSVRTTGIRNGDSVVLYNLACSMTQNGLASEAIATLRTALQCGYDDFEHLDRDADLIPLHDDPAYLALLAEFRPRPTGKRRSKAQKPKPDHYEIICISIYKDDLARLDAKVDELKRRGYRRMTRSALIRYALDRVAIDDVPRGSF